MKKLSTKIAFVLLLAALSAQALAQSPELQRAVQGEFYQPGEPFVIKLGEPGAALLAEGLTVEFDNIDVTAMARVSETEIVFKPVTRPANGSHQLRLMRYGADGSVAELGYWQIEIRGAGWVQEASLQGQLNVELAQALAESDSIAAQSSGSHVLANGQYEASLKSQNWHTRANASLTYADKAELSLTGENADIPSFFIQSQSDYVDLNIGDHAVASASLIHDGLQRRGLSSSIAISRMNSAVDVFSSSATRVIGVDSGLGVSDGDNRISGASWHYQAVNSPQAQMVFSSSFLSGKRHQSDFATLEKNTLLDEPVNEGSAWNIALDGLYFNRQLRLRLENARSVYDFDGVDLGYNEEQGKAWSALALLDVSSDSEKLENFKFGMEKQYVGTWFKSIANRQLPADKEFFRTFLDTTVGEWQWNASIARQSNNLENNLAYAKTQTSQWVLGGSYQNVFSPSEGSLFSLLGVPTVNWYVSEVEMQDSYTPSGYLANDLQTQSANLNLQFNPASAGNVAWNWSLGLNQDTLKDHTHWQPQTRTRAWQFNTGIQAGKYYYLALGWQLQNTHYVAENVDTSRQLSSLEARGEFIPKRLFANLSLGLNQNQAMDDPYYALRDESAYSAANITWRVKMPKQNRVGLDLSLAVSHSETRDFINDSNNNDGYQVLLKISTVLPTMLAGNTP